MTDSKQTFIKEMINHEILKFGEFQLKSGDKSPFYIDLRLVPSYPKLMKLSIKLLQEALSDMSNEFILAGLISAGVPFATGLSLVLDKPLIQIRSKVKDHGRKKMIEGRFYPEDRVVIVDDLISTGASKLHAIEVIREQELSIQSILVLIDRRPLAEIGTSLDGIPINSVCTIEDIISIVENVPLDLTEDRKIQILESIKKWIT